MYVQKEQLFEQYNFEIEAFGKGRGTIIAETKTGKVVLEEYRGSLERVPALAKVLEDLAQWDETTEQIYATKEGEWYVKDQNGICYLCKSTVPGKEGNPLEKESVLKSVEALAELHLELKKQGLEYERVFRIREHEPKNEFLRHNRQLQSVRNYIRKKKKRNEFELLFCQEFDAYYQQAKQVCKEYEEHVREQQEEKYQLCHGDYHYHNVLFYNKQVHICHYESMRFDHPMSDLAKAMRKYMEKNRWDKELGMEMIRTYQSIQKLDKEDLDELRLRLAYPKRFWKIANHYFGSHKAWVSKRDIEKLTALGEIEGRRKEFLEMLYSLRE